MKCNHCHKEVANRSVDRMVLCWDCWNRLNALADLGEDVLKYYQAGKFDSDLTEILEKDMEFAKKWNNVLKHSK